MATGRSSAKDLALWVSADEATSPTSGDLVAFITSLSPSLSASTSEVTAGGDPWQEHVGGIPGGTISVGGRLNYVRAQAGGEESQLLAWFAAQDKRQFRILWDDNDATNYLNAVGICSAYAQSGSNDGPWDFTATIQLTGALTETRAA